MAIANERPIRRRWLGCWLGCGGGGRAALLATTGLCLAAAACPAWAQEGGPRTDETEPAGQVEEVVVTARRRDENAQSVPVAITAFGGETLEDRRAYNVRDLQQLTPIWS